MKKTLAKKEYERLLESEVLPLNILSKKLKLAAEAIEKLEEELENKNKIIEDLEYNLVCAKRQIVELCSFTYRSHT